MSRGYLIRPSGAGPLLQRRRSTTCTPEGETEHLRCFAARRATLSRRGGRWSEFERQRIAEEAVRTVYIHAHMDEDTFDCSRAMMCPDQVPAEPGRLIPACAYNLFYRMQDERFYVARRPVAIECYQAGGTWTE